ncbi:MAG: patatin-like phospholipase family protein, partial [Planctomycetaceae bacterium]
GVWRALEEAGIRPTEIVGTSIGALVGACIAGGEGARTLTARALSLAKPDIVMLNRWALLFNGIRQPSVFRGDTFQEYVQFILPVKEWDRLAVPLGMNAVHLETGRTEWFGAGGRLDVSLPDAIYASCALPVFYPPADLGGKLYVDGGVGDTLPVTRAAERGAELIIAVDVGAGPLKDSRDTVSRGLVAVHHRVFDIMAYARKRAVLESWRGPELVYVRPALDGWSTFDFTATEYFLEEGYRATRSALEASPALESVAARIRAPGQAAG